MSQAMFGPAIFFVVGANGLSTFLVLAHRARQIGHARLIRLAIRRDDFDFLITIVTSGLRPTPTRSSAPFKAASFTPSLRLGACGDGLFSIKGVQNRLSSQTFSATSRIAWDLVCHRCALGVHKLGDRYARHSRRSEIDIQHRKHLCARA
jgi:hypothetical protein